MKTYKKACSWLVVLLVSLIAVLVASGCATSSGPKGAYPTLKDTQRMVDWPMSRYRNRVSFGGITLGEQQMINQAYAQYSSAFAAALKAASSNYEATTPDDVKALANQVISGLNSLP